MKELEAALVAAEVKRDRYGDERDDQWQFARDAEAERDAARTELAATECSLAAEFDRAEDLKAERDAATAALQDAHGQIERMHNTISDLRRQVVQHKERV